ncbi:MAG: glycosyltransferase family 4 protein [Tepidisphaerales bacterium]
MSDIHLFYIADAPTPYRLHFIRRMHAELPGVTLHTRFTHLRSNAPWSLPLPPDVDIRQVGRSDHDWPLTRKLPSDWHTATQLLREIFDTPRPAVLLSAYNDLARVRVAVTCHHAGIPVLLWVDSNARSDRAAGWKRLLKRAVLGSLFHHIDALLACGSLGRDFLLRYGADADRIFYSPVEPDYADIDTLTPDEIAAAAAMYRLDPARKRLIYSGRLVPEKAVDQLLTAFLRLAPRYSEWDLLVVGDGPGRSQLEEAVPPPLHSRIRFLGFIGQQRRLSALYRNSHALCLPSTYEPWAVVINEAAAAGLAIVASDVVGAAAELVDDGLNGKCFRTNDLDDLTAALDFVLSHPDVRRLGEHSRRVLQRWRARADPIAGLRQALAAVR